jgi:hypothetical protein
MQVSYTTADGSMTATFEGKTQADIWEQIAAFQEVFETRPVTIDGAVIDGKNVQYRKRTVDGNDYYEKVYVGEDKNLRGYKLEYGSLKEPKGGLFPRRKDKDNNWLDNNGWNKWQGNKGGDGGGETKSSSGSGKKGAPF